MPPATATNANARQPFPAPRHDHRRCVAGALAHAEATCRERDLRLTPLRKRVLELVWNSHKPAGAYDVLEHLRRERPSAEPPTVYRALDFLQGAGLVHRIERLNAYVGCACPGQEHAGQFLICTQCGHTAELSEPAIGRALEKGAEAAGFAIESPLVEVEGVCPDCRKNHRRHSQADQGQP